MRGVAWPARVLAAAAAAAVLAGCGGHQLTPGGLFHSGKGYRVAIPSDAWAVVGNTEADLEIRHRSARAGILVLASCDPGRARRPYSVLRRHLLLGLEDRVVLERHEVTLAGRAARRVLLEAAPDAGAERLRIETWTMTDGRCVYDLAYAAPPAQFGTWQEDFARVLGSFTLEP